MEIMGLVNMNKGVTLALEEINNTENLYASLGVLA